MFFDAHNHTEVGSNIRLLDAICKPKDLIDYAIELGLSGVAITEHELVGSAMEVNQYAKKIRKTHPDFTVALGNEIYLTDTREPKQKYFHFLLVAKDAIGHKALRILSSQAWLNSYTARGMIRVPTLKSELREVLLSDTYKGHVMGFSACLGGELPTLIIQLLESRKRGDASLEETTYQSIVDFISYCQEIFGEDFYLECQPGESQEQMMVNQFLIKLGRVFNVRVIVSTDTHFLKKQDRYVHKAYLNSKDGEREVDSFYEYTYLMSEDEVREHLQKCLTDSDIDDIFNATEEVRSKVSFYDLSRPQSIPKVDVVDYPKRFNELIEYPSLSSLLISDNTQERYWVNECLNALESKIGMSEIYLQQLEIEADIILDIGERLHDCLFCYFNTFKHYIDLFWECGSIVGPGRGSACGFLSNYLLGITQLDPLKWGLKWWRFLNKGRAILPDIDIDLDPVIRPRIFEKIREERGELGIVQVCAYGTEATKSAILTACRGYRSDECPDGIEVDTAQYMSSLIPSERGFLWPLKDVVYGNPEKGRKKVQPFLQEVEKYEGLLDIMFGIEGIHNKITIHASGVVLYGNDPYETAAFMRAPSGDIITQYNLTNAELAGDTKYDFLVTEVSTKLRKTLELLQDDGVIERDNLRNLYNKYLHPEHIDTTNPEIWNHLAAGDILDVFQFNEGSGLAIAKKLRPQDPLSMTAANAMMRLMSEPGDESQSDRYVRIKAHPELFDQEMRARALPEDIITAMHEHCDAYFGCAPIQEQMMSILMDERICNFSLEEADGARKVVAKKKMDQIPQLRAKVFERIGEEKSATYVWDTAIKPQLGYAFNLAHSLPYSFVGIQTILLASLFDSIYWNTACLIVNSGSAEFGNGSSTDYAKVAKATNAIRSHGINVSLVDINKSDFAFKPDAANHQILFALKGLVNVSDDFIKEIIANRPYTSMEDFIARIHPKKQAMISLIKAGAFDQFMPRDRALVTYVWMTCDKKNKITLQNLPGLIRNNLLPEKTEEQIMARRVFEFNRYLKKECLTPDKQAFNLTNVAIDFLSELGHEELIEGEIMNAKRWDKEIYQGWMDVFRAWIKEEQETILDNLNTAIFMTDWGKYGNKNNVSAWEMEALCFYYHRHELADINMARYGLSNFARLPEEPAIERTFCKAGATIPIYKLTYICGTCIATNKTKSIVYLLTSSGDVVTVKFRKEYYALFATQVAQVNPDGTKTIVEKSWFTRGSLLMVQGMRRGDEFVAKKYSASPGHTLYKIDTVHSDGTLDLRSERYKGETIDDE